MRPYSFHLTTQKCKGYLVGTGKMLGLCYSCLQLSLKNNHLHTQQWVLSNIPATVQLPHRSISGYYPVVRYTGEIDLVEVFISK